MTTFGKTSEHKAVGGPKEKDPTAPPEKKKAPNALTTQSRTRRFQRLGEALKLRLIFSHNKRKKYHVANRANEEFRTVLSK